MVIPNFGIVVDNSSSEASSWVNPGSSNGYGSQVNHENGEPNRQWGQHLHNNTTHSFIYLYTFITKSGIDAAVVRV